MNTLIFQLPFATGLIYLIAGIFLMLFPPKKKNYFIGYRTSSSMRSQAHWDFAQTYSSKMLIRIGCCLIAFSFLSLTINISELSSEIIALFIVIFSTIYLFRHTESKIKSL